MFITVDMYLKRLTHALEKVIAPEVEDDRVRGQVFAVVNLLEQLGTRIEYKPGLIREDLESNLKTATEVTARMKEAGAEPEAELARLLSDLAGAESVDLKTRALSEEALSRAIELFFRERSRLEPSAAASLEKFIRAHLTKIATRDLGLTKPPNFDKISRSKQEKK